MIKTLEPSIKTHLVDQDAMVTMDHDINRVRIFVDKEGKVARQPKLG